MGQHTTASTASDLSFLTPLRCPAEEGLCREQCSMSQQPAGCIAHSTHGSGDKGDVGPFGIVESLSMGWRAGPVLTGAVFLQHFLWSG